MDVEASGAPIRERQLRATEKLCRTWPAEQTRARVDPAKGGERLRHRGLDGVLVGDVGLDRQAFREAGRDRAGSVAVEVDHGDATTLGAVALGHRRPDPRRATGDQQRLPGEAFGAHLRRARERHRAYPRASISAYLAPISRPEHAPPPRYQRCIQLNIPRIP